MRFPTPFVILAFLPMTLACSCSGGGEIGSGSNGGSGGGSSSGSSGAPDAGSDAAPDAPVQPTDGVSCWMDPIGEWNDYAEAVRVHTTGDVIVAGRFDGEVDLGGVKLTSALGDAGAARGAFVARLRASDGTAVWARTIGAPDDGTGLSSIAIDPDGSVIIGGFTKATLADLGGIAPADPAGGAFIARLDGATGAEGAVIMLDVDGSPKLLERASDGTYIAAGEYVDYARLAPDLPTNASREIWVARVSLDAADTVVWAQRLGDGGSDGPFAIALTPNDDIALGGVVRPSGEVVLRAYVALLRGTDGALQWDHTFATSPAGIGQYKDIATSAIGVTDTEVIAVGAMEDSASVGGEVLPIGMLNTTVWQGSYAMADGAHLRSGVLFDSGSTTVAGIIQAGGVLPSGALWLLGGSGLQLYTPDTFASEATYKGGAQLAGDFDPASSRWFVSVQGGINCWRIP